MSLTEILRWLGERDFCALATSDPGGRPHCSLMSPALARDGRSLYLLMLEGSRKQANLAANPQVSLLFDDRDQAATPGDLRALTATGQARAVDESPERDQALALLLARHPHLKPLADGPGWVVVEVRLRRLQLLTGPVQAQSLDLT